METLIISAGAIIVIAAILLLVGAIFGVEKQIEKKVAIRLISYPFRLNFNKKWQNALFRSIMLLLAIVFCIVVINAAWLDLGWYSLLCLPVLAFAWYVLTYLVSGVLTIVGLILIFLIYGWQHDN